MDLTPAVRAGLQLVERYGGGRFKVGGVVHEGAVLVCADRTIALPAEADIPACLAGVEVLLWGCGERMRPVPAERRAALKAIGVVVEPMDTGAAARTYNVLVMEGRRVAAVLEV